MTEHPRLPCKVTHHQLSEAMLYPAWNMLAFSLCILMKLDSQ
jgi:hypothetical protein